MYKEIQKKLKNLINKELYVEIDEGRSRKIKQKAKIKGVYDKIFTIELNNIVISFSYSDIICKTIILKTM